MAQRIRVAAAGAVAFLCLCYAIVLALGLLTLPSPAHQIQEPWFTLMELLIILIAPAMVVFMLALHAWASGWPSVAYALDILAWDLFFPIAALFAALSIPGAGLPSVVRRLMYLSAALALAGLAGVPLANMRVRNIGIVGYAVLLPIAAALMMLVFRRGKNASAD
jgi:hypothetical protein